MVSILQLHYFRHVLRLGALKCCHRFPKRWFKGGLWSVSRCWRIADSALSRVARPSRQSVTVLVNLSRILIASSIINYWWHSSNPPQPTMHLGLVIIEDFQWSIFCDCALCASARQFKGGGMCKCAKKKEFREWPMLDLNLSWQCLQKISLGQFVTGWFAFPAATRFIATHCQEREKVRKKWEISGKVTQWLIQSGWQGLTAWNGPLLASFDQRNKRMFLIRYLGRLGIFFLWSDPCCGESNGNMDISNDWSPIAPWFCNPIGQMCSLVGFFNQMHGQYPLGTLVHWYRCGGGEVVCSLCRLSALQLYISSLGWLIYRPITGHRVGLMAIKVEQLAIWAKAYRERTLRYKIETVWCPAFLNGGQIQFATWTNTFCTPR